jgi:hypothetical protein
MFLSIIRFIIFAMVYVAAVLFWAKREGGHGAMGIVGGAVVLSGGAVAAWLVGILVEHYSSDLSVRLLVHVISTTVAFLAISYLILVLLDSTVGYELDIYLNFGGIVAGASIVDGLTGLLSASSKRDTA